MYLRIPLTTKQKPISCFKRHHLLWLYHSTSILTSCIWTLNWQGHQYVEIYFQIRFHKKEDLLGWLLSLIYTKKKLTLFHASADAKIFSKSWTPPPPQKLLRNTQIHFFFLTASTAQMAKTEEFMFQNVAYRLTGYKTGGCLFIIDNF